MSGSSPEPEAVTRSIGTGWDGIVSAGLGDVTLNSGDQLLVGLCIVRTAGVAGVVAVAGSGRAAMEVFVGGEILPDQLRSDDCAVARNEFAVGLSFQSKVRKRR